MSADNVFSALEEIEFESFIQPLRESLDSFRKMHQEKKATKTTNGNKSTTDLNETEGDADMETEEQETHFDEYTDGTEIEE